MDLMKAVKIGLVVGVVVGVVAFLCKKFLGADAGPYVIGASAGVVTAIVMGCSRSGTDATAE